MACDNALTDQEIADLSFNVKAVSEWAEGGPTDSATMANGRVVPSPSKLISDAKLFKDPVIYSAAVTYTDATVPVIESDIVYAPVPTFLPIGPEAFDPNKWYVLQGASSNPISLDTLKANGGIAIGAFVNSSEYITGSGEGAGLYEKVSVDPGFNLINPNTSDGNWLKLLPDLAVTPFQAGAIADGIADDNAAITEADAYAVSIGLPLNSGQYTYVSSVPLILSANSDWGSATIVYTGTPGAPLALTWIGRTQQDESRTYFNNLTLENRNTTEPDEITLTKNVTLPFAAAFAVLTQIGGSTAPTVTVPFAGVTIGAMVSFSNFNLPETIQLTGQCLINGEVLIHVNNWDQLFSFAGVTENIDITVMNNPIHGISLRGSLWNAGGIRVIGFTGLSVGMGAGTICPTSGVDLGVGERNFYTSLDIQITVAHGYGMEIPARNNTNEYAVTVFGSNFYSDTAPFRPSCIHQVILQGIGNTFNRLTLEGQSSQEPLLVNHSSNQCNVSFAYVERSASWQAPDNFGAARLASTSSAIRGDIRASGFYITDRGVGNNVTIPEGNYIAGGAIGKPVSGLNLLINGDFGNNLDNWSDFGTSTFDGVFTEVFIGRNSVRFTSVNQAINLQQTMPFEIPDGVPYALGVWVIGTSPGIGIRIDSKQNGASSRGTGEWEFLISRGVGPASVVQIRTTSGQNTTGTIDISAASIVLGNQPLGLS